MISPYLFIITAIVYIILEINTIKKYKSLRLISLFRLMYTFVFGLLPAIILFRVDAGSSDILQLYSKEYISTRILVFWLITVIEYIIVSLAYKYSKPKYSEIQMKNNHNILYYSEHSIRVAIIISLVVGIVSLYLWTRAYGTVFNMIVQANLVRANASDVVNPWAFLEHFARVFTFAYFVSLALLLYKKKQNKGTLFSFTLLILSLSGALVVMMCTDTRGEIGIIAIVTILYYFVFYKWKDNSLDIKKLSRTGILFFIAFLLIIKSADVMDSIRGFELDKNDDSFSLVETLEKEFGFTFASAFTALKDANEHPFQLLFVDDIINALFAWFPSRFIPFELPTTLWDYNTELQQQRILSYGQAPTDFISASLYLFGYPGIMVLPLFMGWGLRKLDTFFLKRRNDIFFSAFYGYMFFFSIWWAGYYSLSSTTLSLFGVFLFWLLLKTVKLFVK